MRRALLTAAATTAAALTLAACGSTEPAADSGSEKSSEAITLTDGTGAKVKLDGPATKVVATEWNVVESLVSLGVKPAGVADVKGYTTWDTSAPLTNSPKDIGTRGEPSTDTVAAIAPDLIVATTDLPASAVKQLKKIAPVLSVKSADGTGQIDQMLANVDLIAKATGTTDQAESVREDFEAKVAEGKKALAGAGLAGADYAFADGYVASNQVTVRPYTATSLIGEVSEAIGLKNAWTVKGDAAYGLGSTDVEGLTGLPDDTHFAYIGNDEDESATPFAGALAKNSVWKSLPFVKSGTVHRLDDGIWMFGGPASMSAYIDSVVAALTK
ncbi:iron-siderophore ABC transporter substrate-binding protein [Streptomyces griseoviridis]|jgi:iron complex transport system substrate-binding protein|uniref:Iron complex transport system substrate-binding protein n=3 Tax=Streptomyces TaxID=1883 RepID=A0ABT9L811_STRGD|nr:MULTISPECIES: iron-siderophore ABC transporter substrate-binding protein [Streptomyces]MDP9679844.1 iron complex transport system substrate-binding protein [Streptomyces griseoviridis]GGS63350.1 ABC transporter substrate-binding protein [Streptomyces niveoruber]GGT24447.1 ABC transporter substrate-binding protein [Streptomyces griseoviridis]GGU58688.1 ABC transporter substrate-binding protein [Streptomyces daghestanicus]GHI30120.1 ABC transporter substrate-binding protein [Streptomyces dagh